MPPTKKPEKEPPLETVGPDLVVEVLQGMARKDPVLRYALQSATFEAAVIQLQSKLAAVGKDKTPSN